MLKRATQKVLSYCKKFECPIIEELHLIYFDKGAHGMKQSISTKRVLLYIILCVVHDKAIPTRNSYTGILRHIAIMYVVMRELIYHPSYIKDVRTSFASGTSWQKSITCYL